MGRPRGSKNRRTLARETIMGLVAATGKTPLEVMFDRMHELLKRDDEESKREAVEVAAMAAPYVHPRLASQTVSATTEVKSVIRVPEKAQSAEAWLATWQPILATTPTKVDEIN
jgi:hypothetical protein